MSQPPGWSGILDPGETVLWQGQPDDSITFGPGTIGLLIFGLLFAGFALFWMVVAAGAGGMFWMFGLLHFCVGAGICVGAVAWRPWTRHHTWYTLTDRRAFIATDMPILGRSLKSYPITAETVLETDGAEPATIWFHEETRQGRNGPSRYRVGFERVSDGAALYRQMRKIQKGVA